MMESHAAYFLACFLFQRLVVNDFPANQQTINHVLSVTIFGIKMFAQKGEQVFFFEVEFLRLKVL